MNLQTKTFGGVHMRFENKVAMVTVASVGIGRACAVRLAKEGAKLVLLDINA